MSSFKKVCSVGVVLAAILPRMVIGAALPDGGSLPSVKTTYTPTFVSVLNEDGKGVDHGPISQKIIEHSKISEHAVEVSFYLPQLYNKPKPCTLGLDLIGSPNGDNWAVGNSSEAVDNFVLKITPLEGTLHRYTDYLGKWADAKLGQPWEDTILGVLDPNTRTLISEPAKGLCGPGENNFLLQTVEKHGMFVWWMERGGEHSAPETSGLKLTF